MKRRFICNRYHGYSIRGHYFTPNPTGGGCYFETEDPEVIALIESVDNYGVDIHPTETVEELAAMKAKVPDAYAKPAQSESSEDETPDADSEEEEETEPIAHRGARGTQTTRRQRGGDIRPRGGRK